MIKVNRIGKRTSTVVGAGLITLDVILNGAPTTPAKLCAGGSCGNVLSILSYLGWKSKPIARLSNNIATNNLFEDFLKFDVDTSLITSTDDGKTPIIIHRILKDKNGNPKHKFEFKIPNTNVWLPMYKPVLAKRVNNIVSSEPNPNVFYFDRVSRSTLDLAKFYKENGATIIFEPSSLKEDKLTLECLNLAHIIKFSKDRVKNYSELYPNANSLLEIETLGSEGLQYRLKSNNEWKQVLPFKLDKVIDSAGAGDWCTAGIINEVGQNGLASFENLTEEQIVQALIIGQALGGLNCAYDGARGLMYNVDQNYLIQLIESIINNSKCIIRVPQINSHTDILTIRDLEFESLL